MTLIAFISNHQLGCFQSTLIKKKYEEEGKDGREGEEGGLRRNNGGDDDNDDGEIASAHYAQSLK